MSKTTADIKVHPRTGAGEGAPTATNSRARSPEFVGRAVAALAADGNRLEKTYRVLTVPELSHAYAFSDLDGKQQSTFWDEHWAAPH